MGFDTNTVKRNSEEEESHRRYVLPRIEIKDYNVLIMVVVFMTKTYQTK